MHCLVKISFEIKYMTVINMHDNCSPLQVIVDLRIRQHPCIRFPIFPSILLSILLSESVYTTLNTQALEHAWHSLILTGMEPARLLLLGTMVLPLTTLLRIAHKFPWPIFELGHDLLSLSCIGLQTLIHEWNQLRCFWHTDASYQSLPWNCSLTALTYIWPRSWPTSFSLCS